MNFKGFFKGIVFLAIVMVVYFKFQVMFNDPMIDEVFKKKAVFYLASVASVYMCISCHFEKEDPRWKR